MTVDQSRKGHEQRIRPGSVRKLILASAADEFTGRMIFRRGQYSCSFYFDLGYLIHAKTNYPEHRLGEILLAAHLLDERSIAIGLKLSQAKEQPLGIVLVGEKMIRPRDLYHALVRQVEMVVKEVAAWDAGTCYIHEGVDPGKGVVRLHVPAARALGETEKAPPASGREEMPAAEAAPEPPPLVEEEAAPEPPPLVEEEAAPEPPPETETPPPPPIPKSRGEEAVLQFIAEKQLLKEGDHYGLLGVKPDVLAQEVKFAYQRIVREFHPDRMAHRLLERDLANLQGIFARINASYALLSDREKRSLYDQHLKEDFTGKPAAEDSSPVEEALRLFQAAFVLMKANKYSQAADYLKKACQLDPTRAKYFYYLGATNFKGHRLKQAEEALLKAVDLDNSSPDYYVALGQVYKAGKLLNRARDMFERALRWDPFHRGAHKELRSMNGHE